MIELFDVGLELPVMVVDDDFVEYLEEESTEGTIEMVEFAELFAQWLKENT